ncbi:CBS domain-containing protein [Streptomyces sp. VRA16 Mangrove soil]|uniref:CBS domain-containing protein n=1 Tax=Streptomyces sp. VRA16 Mangrove soil TaxID=2817434 RepID=UPI001AA0034F|nr:CBS domain-containing protein [Streptomyces sp. VRA16 Mangrove soil]MBO1330500.1 CBS domain-containing protein [Streptomyces sp. VRA16 Mangrove soil]
MTTAREIMTGGARCVAAHDSAADAARKLKEFQVGALPICGENNRLVGVLTDRDIVVKVLGEGLDPAEVEAGTLAQGEAVTIGADDDAEEIFATMTRHKVHRLPVIDGNDLVGMIALADVARGLTAPEAGLLIEALSSD